MRSHDSVPSKISISGISRNNSSRNCWLKQPVTTSSRARPVSLYCAACKISWTDSSLAASINVQVLTTMTSACAGSSVNCHCAFCNNPIIISASTKFFEQPRLITATCFIQLPFLRIVLPSTTPPITLCVRSAYRLYGVAKVANPDFRNPLPANSEIRYSKNNNACDARA